MTREEIEHDIRDLLESEANYWMLSDKLFGPDGLFGELGPTYEERKIIGRSALFRDAQHRIRSMEFEIAERLKIVARQHLSKIDRNAK